MPYQLQYRSSVKKELRKVNKSDLPAIIRKIQSLQTEPHPKDSVKLQGSRDLFRVRHGDYRIIYRVKNDVLIIVIIRVGDRREIYRNL